jgi:sterol 3beta-glucosyltransferase
MHIRLLAIGTRGDVQPYVALALGLQRAGYDVAIGTTANFRDFVESYGLKCIAAAEDIQAISTRARQKRGRKAKWEVFRILLETTLALTEGADALIYSSAAILSAPHVAEKLGIPAFPALLQPFYNPTRQFPAVLMPALPLGGWYNRFTYTMFEWFTWTFLKGAINRWRQQKLGLPPFAGKGPFTALRERQVPTFYAISPTVLPKPPEWGDHVHVTGYWFLDHDPNWQPPATLVDFIHSGEAPVYIGFGSIASRDAQATGRLVLEAVQRAGVRAVISSGWEGIAADAAPDNVMLIKGAPHDWLFPQMSAVVHHGGSGTTGAGLRAGKPTVIVPAGGDQPFWGRRVHELGAGTPPIPRKRLTVENLAAAIRAAVNDTSMRQCAESLGEAIRAENGVGNAVRIIQQALGEQQPAGQAAVS